MSHACWILYKLDTDYVFFVRHLIVWIGVMMLTELNQTINPLSRQCVNCEGSKLEKVCTFMFCSISCYQLVLLLLPGKEENEQPENL
jgi:ABC-type xylose transport system permease subunit